MNIIKNNNPLQGNFNPQGLPQWSGQQQAPQQAQPVPQQAPQGLLGRIGGGLKQMTSSPDFYDRMAVGLGGMTTNPNVGLIKMSQDRIAQRQKMGVANRTAQSLIAKLRASGEEQLAGMIEANPSMAKAIYQEYIKKTLNPKDTKGVYTAADLEGMGLGKQPEGLYNLSRNAEGKATGLTKVGGASTTVNLGDKSTPLETAASKLYAETYMGEITAGRAARVTLGNTQVLERLLSTAKTGGFEAATKTLAKNTFGVDIGDDKLTAANAILAKLIPAQRPKGSGTMSDADLAMFKSSLPSIMNKQGGNALILKTMSSIANYQIEMGRIATLALNSQISPMKAEEMMAELPDPLKETMAFMDAMDEPVSDQFSGFEIIGN